MQCGEARLQLIQLTRVSSVSRAESPLSWASSGGEHIQIAHFV